MPIKRPCAEPGCSKLVEQGRCPDHLAEYRQQYDQRRGNARQRGYTARWDRLARRYRRKHPLCEHCLQRGRTTPAAVVDHIMPARQRPDRFWDPGNWQSLCQACHNAKTAHE